MRSSPDRAVWVRALAGDIMLCSWTRHVTVKTRSWRAKEKNLSLGHELTKLFQITPSDIVSMLSTCDLNQLRITSRVHMMNRPFPRSLVPLFQNESKCETFLSKTSSACSFIFMQIKVILIGIVSHLDTDMVNLRLHIE